MFRVLLSLFFLDSGFANLFVRGVCLYTCTDRGVNGRGVFRVFRGVELIVFAKIYGAKLGRRGD